MHLLRVAVYNIYNNNFLLLLLIRSAARPVLIGSGFNICPRGYILALNTPSANAFPRLGHCIQCSAGTYSVNPLYGGRDATGGGETVGVSDSPKCLLCAAGGVCLGGDKVLVHALAY